MEIPYTELSAETLRGVIEDFVLREGTDYGDVDYSLDQKVEQVMRQLKAGKVKILFDAKEETCTLVRA